MSLPDAGDLLIRYERETDRYFIIDAVTRVPVAGPFSRLEFAVGIANSMAYKTAASVWREHVDQHGVVAAPPQLLTPYQRPLASSNSTTEDTADDEEQPQ